MITLNDRYRFLIGLSIMVILHTVGAVGMSIGFLAQFAELTPINLVVCSAVLVLLGAPKSKQHWILLLAIFIIGFAAEAVGTNLGLLFGDYYYGENMGFKILGVPPIIGINWCILVFGATELLYGLKANIFLKGLLSGALVVGLDILLEPLAPILDFWYWPSNGDVAPFFNYASWFVLSTFFSILLFAKGDYGRTSHLAIGYLLIQIAFFAVLNITLF